MPHGLPPLRSVAPLFHPGSPRCLATVLPRLSDSPSPDPVPRTPLVITTVSLMSFFWRARPIFLVIFLEDLVSGLSGVPRAPASMVRF